MPPCLLRNAGFESTFHRITGKIVSSLWFAVLYKNRGFLSAQISELLKMSPG